MLSGKDLCDELITCPEESYRLWRVVVCDLETSRMRRSWPTRGCCSKKNNVFDIKIINFLSVLFMCDRDVLQYFKMSRTVKSESKNLDNFNFRYYV